MSELRITLRDCVAAGACGKGVRAWCVKHNFSWREMVQEGLPADKLIATGDAMAIKIVETTRGRK